MERILEELVQDGKNTIRAITGILGTILTIITALSFLQGFSANLQNVYTILGFLLCWAVFSALSDELDSVLKKGLASVGIPAVIIGLVIVVVNLL